MRATDCAFILLLCAAAACTDIVPPADQFAAKDVAVGADGVDASADVDANTADLLDIAAEISVVDADTQAVDAEILSVDGQADADANQNCSVVCPEKACQTATCDKATGECAYKAVADSSPCDDKNACTSEACAAGVCKVSSMVCECQVDADCKGKEDGNFCNGTLYCDTSGTKPKCVINPATLVTCPSVDDTPCVKNACDKKTGSCGMVVTPGALVACDDNNKCTSGDTCDAGVCVAGTNTCKCTKDSDCTGQEDGDVCNGTLYCDKTGSLPVCTINPATIVVCPTGSDTACSQTTCDIKTGKCSLILVKDDTKCDDGNACSIGDICSAGVCKAGADTCSCKTDSDCSKFDDGNLCNGTLYCDKSGPAPQCKLNPKTLVKCVTVDDTACRHNLCHPKTGVCAMVDAPKNTLCDADNNPCTSSDACDKGQCLPSANLCFCTNDGDCANKEDGNPCNGTLFCDKTVSPAICSVNPKTVVVCDSKSDSQCHTNTCNISTGSCAMVLKANFTPCEDNDVCTTGDVCMNAACVSGTNTCICTGDNQCYDDGDKCNGTPACNLQKQKCEINPATIVTCPATGGGCVDNVCNPQNGLCGLQKGACDDKNPCTVDACDLESQKCVSKSVVDGVPCGDGLACFGGACKGSPKDMKVVPGGTAWMGCDSFNDANCLADAQPMHEVTLATFLIDSVEVKVADYKDCVTAGVCLPPQNNDPHCNIGQVGKGQHPVNCIKHADATAYCGWKSKTLPTESQWERAARGDCTPYGADCKVKYQKFPWQGPAANCSYCVMFGNATGGCDTDSTWAVGVHPGDKSPYGVRDLGGNVREWVGDWYDPAWYAAPSDPKGPAAGTKRVTRGGSFVSSGKQVRADLRAAELPEIASFEIGFRCAKTP